MYPDYKKQASIILGAGDPKEPSDMDGLDMATDEMMKAFHSADKEKLKSSMRSFIDMHNTMKEMDHDAGEDSDEME